MRALPSRASLARDMRASSLFVAVVLLAGCGHPATEKECEEIVERVAKLELQSANANAETVAEEVKIAKESFKRHEPAPRRSPRHRCGD